MRPTTSNASTIRQNTGKLLSIINQPLQLTAAPPSNQFRRQPALMCQALTDSDELAEVEIAWA